MTAIIFGPGFPFFAGFGLGVVLGVVILVAELLGRRRRSLWTRNREHLLLLSAMKP